MNRYIYTFQFNKGNQPYVISWFTTKRNLTEAMREIAKDYDVPVSELTLICFYDMTKDEE